jgi:uncharacterized membrane protein YoaK (UPF0700 family)
MSARFRLSEIRPGSGYDAAKLKQAWQEMYRGARPPRRRDHTCVLCEAGRLRATAKDYPSSAFGFACGAILGTALGVLLSLAAMAVADWWVR